MNENVKHDILSDREAAAEEQNPYNLPQKKKSEEFEIQRTIRKAKMFSDYMNNIEVVETKAREIENQMVLKGEIKEARKNEKPREVPMDIIEGGRKFLPDVDFDKFEKYSFLFDESKMQLNSQ